MQKDAVAADGVLLENADPHELLEMDGGALALGDTGIDDVTDATVGLAEDHLEQQW